MTRLERLQKAVDYALANGRAESQNELALKAGLSKGYISKTKWELKRDPNYDPGAVTMAQLAEAAGVRAEWLSWEDGEMVAGGAQQQPRTAAPGDLPETLRQLVESYPWPTEMTPQQVSNVLKGIRADMELEALDRDLPRRVWFNELQRRCKRELGEAGAEPKDPPARSRKPKKPN